MIKKMKHGNLDELAADDEHLKRIRVNDVPDNDITQLHVHEILRELAMLPLSAASACFFKCLDALAASSIPCQEHMRKLQENAVATCLSVPHDMGLNDSSVLHRCRSIEQGNAETENDGVPTTFAGHPDGLCAVPIHTASIPPSTARYAQANVARPVDLFAGRQGNVPPEARPVDSFAGRQARPVDLFAGRLDNNPDSTSAYASMSSRFAGQGTLALKIAPRWACA